MREREEREKSERAREREHQERAPREKEREREKGKLVASGSETSFDSLVGCWREEQVEIKWWVWK